MDLHAKARYVYEHAESTGRSVTDFENRTRGERDSLRGHDVNLSYHATALLDLRQRFKDCDEDIKILSCELRDVAGMLNYCYRVCQQPKIKQLADIQDRTPSGPSPRASPF